MPLHKTSIAPWTVSNDAASLTGAATTVLTANVVYLYAFEVMASITVTGCKWHMGTTATGTTDVGVYDANGNLLGHTGAVANVASTNMSNALSGGNLTLAPGQYFLALCPSNSTDTYQAVSATSPKTPTSRNRQGVTGGTAGVLPTTTGGYTDTPAQVPAMALALLNGLT